MFEGEDQVKRCIALKTMKIGKLSKKIGELVSRPLSEVSSLLVSGRDFKRIVVGIE